MLQQYLDVKDQYKDYILFFRLGDFYEMFFDDAVTVSRELSLALTGRDCGLPERAPMCGIPYHATEGYIKRLVDKGYKVAICEQMEDPAKAKGLVKRSITRLITPGTLIEEGLLTEETNNYIASAVVEEKAFAVCFADISTGEAFLTQREAENPAVELITELGKFSPSEVRISAQAVDCPELGAFLRDKLRCLCDLYSDKDLEEDRCLATVLSHFEGRTLEDLGIVDMSLAVRALGALIAYLNGIQMEGAKRLSSINLYREDQYMSLDITARRNLELTRNMRDGGTRGTLLQVLDKTRTAMGKRYMCRALEQPLLNLAEITRRQTAVEELSKNASLRERLSASLSGVYDLERLMTRVLYASVNPREVKSLSGTIGLLPEIKTLLRETASPLLTGVNRRIHYLEDVCNLVDNTLTDDPPAVMKDGGYIRPGFSAELDEYRELCDGAVGYMAKLEASERERTGIKNLKVSYNKVYGYYIEVTNSYKDMVPPEYIRRQTLVGGERYVTPELKELETKVLTANSRRLALEASIFDEVRRFLATKIDAIQETAGAIGQLDFVLALAVAAAENGYVRPTVTMDGVISIKNGRHPVVEHMLKDSLFVPNDTLLDTGENRTLIITGPNMAGKSTYMRQVAVLTVMAQIGSFVPASSASVSLCDKIFTRVGASDDLAAGQSTFMVEMNEVAHILQNATPKSLVILDEIGRGTSTFDGMSIAKAVLFHLTENKKLRCKTLFATHYHELTALEGELAGVKNYNVVVKKRGDDITFLRKIVRGGADESYGIEVAKLAGVPDAVVELAKKFLSELNASGVPMPAPKREEAAPPEEEQVSLAQNGASRILARLAAVQPDTLTPIEALNVLYELKKAADSLGGM